MVDLLKFTYNKKILNKVMVLGYVRTYVIHLLGIYVIILCN